MAPGARLSDGALTVVTVSGHGTCGLLGLMMLKLMEGTHLGPPERAADGVSDQAVHAVNLARDAPSTR